MSITFTPSNAVDMSKEKEWASSLGMLDWDSTRIVFTKRSLIEFLKTAGVTVDTNFSNVSKLPKYATFGKFSEDVVPQITASTSNLSVSESNSDVFKPTRRVREAPGGKHTDIFGDDFQDEGDALSTAPPRDGTEPLVSPPLPSKASDNTVAEEEHTGFDFSSRPKPSRRVRTNPGGTSTIGSLWGDEPAQEEFKPTRRVRQGPGGTDSVASLF
ncbi:hypothetical protein Moror_14716 [Moniliophthora roreri MCA 2997]|uniref:Uncharacterized protein n=2 Tax=Moniliophthora roreri TaxID=221103 RepID=V2X3P7_MONRO|nr:hypothetical protein Moror_14716 [Moniliophthora roreri MCA 2997]KAI3610715.1 hypothetical protein WG66_007199 [Moniliophthora roreri]